MTSPSDTPRESEDTCDLMAIHLESFLSEWESNGYGPNLADHLPPGPERLRRMVLIELIKADLEYRCESGGPILRLEDYLEEYPELDQPDGMPAELIHEEHLLRNRSLDETIDITACVARFPDQEDAIRRLFRLNQSQEDSRSGSEIGQSWRPGDRIGDFYLMSEVGTGTFGSVFLARQESIQRLVALKISADRGTEAQTLAQLDHPNIVRVYDQVRLGDEQLRLLYMQFVSGGTLQAVVQASRRAGEKTGQLVAQCIAESLSATGVLSSADISLKDGLETKPWAEVVCQLGIELAQALHYAHEQGILHRDVKPANVLLEANGSAKLADFNISFSSAVEGDTAAASFGGSLVYMSPEQLDAFHPHRDAQPSDLDARSDIYSLGVLLWELLYGERPFADITDETNVLSLVDGMRQQRAGGPPVASASAADSAEEMLRTILERCLQPDPQNRYQSAGALARELALCQQPRVAQLICQSQTGWRLFAVKWPLLVFLFTAVSPHVLAAAFNYYYNDKQIVENLQPHEETRFEQLVLIINGVAFSVAFAFCIWFSGPVVRAIRRRHQGATSPDTAARLRSLRLSRFVTILGITEWVIAGMAYPLALSLSVRSGDLSAIDGVHFFGSLLICGLLAAAYPFYLTATVAIRSFMPTLLRHDRLTQGDVNRLRQLARQSGWSLYLAGGVPAVAIVILLTTQEASHDASRVALLALSLLGAIGFAFLLSLSRTLEADVEALREAYRLPDAEPDAD